MTLGEAPINRRTLGKIAVASAGLAFLSACQSDDNRTSDQADRTAGDRNVDPTADPTSSPSPKPSPTAQARIDLSLGSDLDHVRPDQAVRVTVTGGKLVDVVVSTPKGAALLGTYDSARTTWTASQILTPDTAYEIRAAARNPAGVPTAVERQFRTVRPEKVLGTGIAPLNGQVVGVGMPLVVTFSEPAKDDAARAALEKRLVVEMSRPVEGAWHWFNDKEVHYRPRVYWPAGTKVTLRINTLGATNGDGAWGIKNKVKIYTIGRSVITKTDLKTKRMRIFIDGKLTRTIKVTGGQKDWETRVGTKVILEKRRNINFTNDAIGAPEEYNLTAPYGLRVTWSGEFLHSAAWSVRSHGVRNVSHGCIGMSVENSKWLWTVSQVGDPAETINTGGEAMSVFGNGYGDWNMSWAKWKAGSALV